MMFVPEYLYTIFFLQLHNTMQTLTFVNALSHQILEIDEATIDTSLLREYVAYH
jgi:hypothetical protein